jgi:hypothetical protein
VPVDLQQLIFDELVKEFVNNRKLEYWIRKLFSIGLYSSSRDWSTELYQDGLICRRDRTSFMT